MASTQYGPVVIAVPGANGLDSEKEPVVVSRTQGGVQETELYEWTPAGRGDPITSPDPDDTTGRATWYGPDGYEGSMWVQDPLDSAVWWDVPPVGIGDRVGGVSKITLNGVDQAGVVPINIPDVSGFASASSVASKADQSAVDSLAAAISNLSTPSLDAIVDTSSAVVGDNVLHVDDEGAVSMVPATDDGFKWGGLFNAGADVSSVPPGSFYAARQAASTTFAPTVLGGNGAGSSTAPPNSVDYTLTQAVPVGAMLWVFAVASAESSLDAGFSVTDSKSNAWAQQAFFREQSTTQVAALRAHVTTALASGDTITLHTSITRNRLAFLVVVVTGALTAAATDSPATGTGGSNASTTSLAVTSSAATAQADELVFGFFGFNSFGTTFTPAADWTQLGSLQVSDTGSGERGIVVEYKRLTSVQPSGGVQASGTLSTAQAYAAGLVFVKKAA